MDAVEQFFSSLGWGLVFLGLLSCLLPKCFKRGVLIMIAGDFFLMLAILFPRMFVELGIFKLDLSYKPVAYLLALIVWGALVVPHFIKWLRGRKNAQNLKKQEHDVHHQALDSSLAPAAIFNSVKSARKQDNQASSLLSGVSKEEH